MKWKITAVAIAVIIIVSSLASILITENNPPQNSAFPAAFVGVAYCGNSVADGKALIEKVKGYTNLFVLQSGLLQRDLSSVEQLGDYAVSSGMYFLPYFGQVQPNLLSWLTTAKQKWGSHLLGVYYGDEVGGKMIDGYVEFKDNQTGDTILKTTYGDIFVTKQNKLQINYELSGVIHLYQPVDDATMSEQTFYPNGTIQTIKPNPNGFAYKSYQELLKIKPLNNLNETAQRFLTRDRTNIYSLKSNSTLVFTSDYALHWFDYLAGYDVVLGQVGWNYSLPQQIAFMRGAANLQNKSWGIIITWKYQNPPYLDNGTEILSQMQTAYECGAKYFVLFDYYFDDDPNPYGTLQEQHFEALQAFWNQIINNPRVIQGSVKADTAVVFPANYGWGARWNGDKVWGIYIGDQKMSEIWGLMQSTLREHGFNTDIVIDDPNFPLADSYRYVYSASNLP